MTVSTRSRRGGVGGGRRDFVAPRIQLVPAYRTGSGEEALELLDMAGVGLDPEQEWLLVHSLGERPDGRWAASSVGLCEPRQNGKGEIILARELVGLFLLEEALQLHSAHLFKTSLEAFRRLLAVIEGTPDFSRRVKRVSRSHGEEGIELTGGQRIHFQTRTSGAGRGLSGDVVYLDEAMYLQEAHMGALTPTLSARPNPQLWFTGSAVDQMTMEHGLVFARQRANALTGEDPALLYAEWGMPVHDLAEAARLRERGEYDPLLDDDLLLQANPAYGRRISRESIELEFRSMDRRTFAVERGGVGDWPSGETLLETEIDLEVWDDRIDRSSQIVGKPWFGVDVSPERRFASISAGGRRKDGRYHVELVERQGGTGWIVAAAKKLKSRQRPAGFVASSASPAASLVNDFAAAGIELKLLSAEEEAAAFGIIVDAVNDGGLRHLGQEELRAAIKGAATRPLGDRKAWSRKSSAVDITPLVSGTNATWGASHAPARKSTEFSFA